MAEECVLPDALFHVGVLAKLRHAVGPHLHGGLCSHDVKIVKVDIVRRGVLVERVPFALPAVIEVSMIALLNVEVWRCRYQYSP